MMIKRFVFLLLPLISCGEATEYCTEMGCVDGLQINFMPALTTAGTYIFTATLDGITETTLLQRDGFVKMSIPHQSHHKM